MYSQVQPDTSRQSKVAPGTASCTQVQEDPARHIHVISAVLHASPMPIVHPNPLIIMIVIITFYEKKQGKEKLACFQLHFQFLAKYSVLAI